MSYGWLTESAFLPSQRKKIDIDSSSFLDVKVNLLKEKEKLKSTKQSKLNSTDQMISSQIKFKDKLDQEQESPYKVDKELVTTIKEPELDYTKVKDNLSRKQKIYEKLKNSKFLSKEEESFKEQCLIDFDYKRLFNKDNKNESVEDIHRVNTIELKLEEKNDIKQSYDPKLSQEAKNSLKDVIKEECDYKKQLLLLKRKKEQEREERLKRIKLMKKD